MTEIEFARHITSLMRECAAWMTDALIDPYQPASGVERFCEEIRARLSRIEAYAPQEVADRDA